MDSESESSWDSQTETESSWGGRGRYLEGEGRFFGRYLEGESTGLEKIKQQFLLAPSLNL